MLPRWLLGLALLTFPLLAHCAADDAAGAAGGDGPSWALAPGDPIPGASADALAAFQRGDSAFELDLREASGLGPLYIRASCAACHASDLRGPGLVQKMAVVEADGLTPAADQTLLAFGHTVRPLRAAGATTAILAPDDPRVRVTIRVGPAVLGRGLLEAIADEAIEARAAEQAAGVDGVRGRVQRVVYASETSADPAFHAHVAGDAVIGRFGLKARVATLDDFTADAFQGDMGITSPLRPTELENPDGLGDDARPGVDVPIETVADIATYMRLLAVPTRVEVPGGLALFEETGCGRCHAPTMRTRSDYPIAPLADVNAEVYTDLLVHDMGPALADGMTDGGASSREWRTAPLIGVRFARRFLHDGRAGSVREAIALHDDEGSEGTTAARRFAALGPGEQELLLRFVEGL